jgi:hypothetical protein
MVSERLYELILKIVMGPLFLKIRVCIRSQPLRVVNLHVGVVGPQTIKGYQVDDGFFPRVRQGVLQVLHRFGVVIFYLMQGAFLGLESLSDHVWHRV